jgi:hypothetical protein
LEPQWKWDRASRSYGNYGNANQWTVNAGLTSLARESAQNSNDARFDDAPGELEYTFIRLTGEHKAAFEAAADWHSGLLPHLDAMARCRERGGHRRSDQGRCRGRAVQRRTPAPEDLRLRLSRPERTGVS